MKIKFVSESKMDDLLDGPFLEFEDDSPEAQEWETMREAVHRHLVKFAPDEESAGSDGVAGFLLQDNHDNTGTLGMEFNAVPLICSEVLFGIAGIGSRVRGFQISITVLLDGMMQNLVIRDSVVYVPKTKLLQRLMKA